MPESISRCTFPGVDMWQLCSIALYLYNSKELETLLRCWETHYVYFCQLLGFLCWGFFWPASNWETKWNSKTSERISKHSGSLRSSYRLHSSTCALFLIEMSFQYARLRNVINHSHWHVHKQHQWDGQSTKWSQEKPLEAVEIFTGSINIYAETLQNRNKHRAAGTLLPSKPFNTMRQNKAGWGKQLYLEFTQLKGSVNQTIHEPRCCH